MTASLLRLLPCVRRQVRASIPCALLGVALMVASGSQGAPERKEVEAIINQPTIEQAPPKDAIVITAEEEAQFDSSQHRAVFLGKVAVDDKQFYMTCDKLTVYLKKDEGGGMERAEAEGSVNILQKKEGTPDEELSRGRAQQAIYEPDKGTVTLIGAPEVQQGINLHRASEYGTRMILNPTGQLQTEGPSRTFIQDRERRP